MEGAPADERETVRGIIEFRGHPMVRASHPTTIEVTTEGYLTEEGDCVVGVNANLGCLGLEDSLKVALKRGSSRVRFKIVVAGAEFELNGMGSPRMMLTHPCEVVIRKSEYISDRTLAIRADAAARDIPREMVRRLKDPRTVGRLEIEVT